MVLGFSKLIKLQGLQSFGLSKKKKENRKNKKLLLQD
jgi:hypothetical protein